MIIMAVHNKQRGQNALITNASCMIIYELKSIHHNDSRRSRIQWFVILWVYHPRAIRRSIGYTTKAITGNGIPKICAAG